MNHWVKRGLTGLLLVGVALAAEAGLATVIPDTAYRQLCMLAMINVVVALSLNVINGMAGQFSTRRLRGCGCVHGRDRRATSTSRSARTIRLCEFVHGVLLRSSQVGW
jgi:hypothetical protein